MVLKNPAHPADSQEPGTTTGVSSFSGCFKDKAGGSVNLLAYEKNDEKEKS